MKDFVERQLLKPDDRGDDKDIGDPDPAKRLPEEEEILFRDNL